MCLCNNCAACERRRTGGQKSLLEFVCGPRNLPRDAEFGPLPPPTPPDRTDPSPFANVRFVSYALEYLRAVVYSRRVLLHPRLQPPSARPGEIVTGLYSADLDVLERMRSFYNERVRGAVGARPLELNEATLSVDRALCSVYLGLMEKYTVRCAADSVSAESGPTAESINESASRLARCCIGSAVKSLFKPYKDWSQPMIEAAMAIVTQVRAITMWFLSRCTQTAYADQARCSTCPYHNPVCHLLAPTAAFFDKWGTKYRGDVCYHQCSRPK